MRSSVAVGDIYEYLQAVIAQFLAIENGTYLFFNGMFNSDDDQCTGELPQLPRTPRMRLVDDSY